MEKMCSSRMTKNFIVNCIIHYMTGWSNYEDCYEEIEPIDLESVSTREKEINLDTPSLLPNIYAICSELRRNRSTIVIIRRSMRKRSRLSLNYENVMPEFKKTPSNLSSNGAKDIKELNGLSYYLLTQDSWLDRGIRENGMLNGLRLPFRNDVAVSWCLRG